jgi:hypothetical protein
MSVSVTIKMTIPACSVLFSLSRSVTRKDVRRDGKMIGAGRTSATNYRTSVEIHPHPLESESFQVIQEWQRVDERARNWGYNGHLLCGAGTHNFHTLT